MAKDRTRIPEEVAAEVEFQHDRTCCVCRRPGRYTQIHHIDHNPTNHALTNLAVLCLDCHEASETRGGFSRKLRPSVVRRFRDDWLNLVSQRRGGNDANLDFPIPEAFGGKGGDASVAGKGHARGGQGGRVGAGGRGRGGDGGSAWVGGNGIAIGGNAGSVDGDRIWFPPAEAPMSEMFAPAYGQPTPGQGGMSGGYLERFLVVGAIRAAYFAEIGKPELVRTGRIDDVPLDRLNEVLAARGFEWRAQVEGRWYLFYVPEA